MHASTTAPNGDDSTNLGSRSSARRRMHAVFAVAAIALIVGGAARLGAAHNQANGAAGVSNQQPVAVRVGTYDSRAVAVAFVRSEANASALRELRAAHELATKAGDERRVREIEGRMTSLQIRRHLQGFSTAPVEDILETVRDELADLAKQRDVVIITRAADYHIPGVELVDVTDAIVALFEPDAATLGSIKELRSHDPEPIEKIAQLPAVK